MIKINKKPFKSVFVVTIYIETFAFSWKRL